MGASPRLNITALMSRKPFLVGTGFGQVSLRRFSGTASLLFTEKHEWIRVEEPGVGTVGISTFAQEQMGEVVFVELPDIGANFKTRDEMATIESVKAVSQVGAVCDCEIVEVNNALEEEPALLNTDPEGRGWIMKVRYSADLNDFTMDRAAYDKGTADG